MSFLIIAHIVATRLLKLWLDPQRLCVFLVTHVVQSITSVVIVIQKQVVIKMLCIKSESFKKYKTQKECQEQKDT